MNILAGNGFCWLSVIFVCWFPVPVALRNKSGWECHITATKKAISWKLSRSQLLARQELMLLKSWDWHFYFYYFIQFATCKQCRLLEKQRWGGYIFLPACILYMEVGLSPLLLHQTGTCNISYAFIQNLNLETQPKGWCRSSEFMHKSHGYYVAMH